MRHFNPKEFLRRLDEGVFDGRLHEELRKLSTDQLEQIAILVARRLRGEAKSTGS